MCTCTNNCCNRIICGKEVNYGNDNLRSYLISHGENYDSIIEKAFLTLTTTKERVRVLEEQKLKDKITNLETLVKNLEDRIKQLEDV